MFHYFSQFLFLFLINLTICSPVHAKEMIQSRIDFPLKPQELLKGDVTYFFKVMSPKTLAKKYPLLAKLDSLSLKRQKNMHLKIGKAAYVVNKPVGFFNDKDLMKEEFVTHFWNGNKITRLGPGTYNIVQAGHSRESFKLTSYFDSDDISTISSFKISRAISATKELDIISKSASTTMVAEKTFSKDPTLGEIFIFSFIPVKENKTFVIQYHLQGIKKPFPKGPALQRTFLDGINQSIKQINSYKLINN